jgi:hypothetical protein
MGSNSIFSMDNLTYNPDFDFISKINNVDDNLIENSNPNNFFDTNDLDSPYLPSNFKCTYLDPLETCTYLCNDNRISLMSINIQSLPAKFNELNELINLFASKKLFIRRYPSPRNMANC